MRYEDRGKLMHVLIIEDNPAIFDVGVDD